MKNIIFDRALIEKCQTNAPRYTSYPTANWFHAQYSEVQQLQKISQNLANKNLVNQDLSNQDLVNPKLVNNRGNEPISLYIHIPFCNTLCLFCACNKIITNNRGLITKYLDYLEQEIKIYYQHIGKKLKVLQLHFGGGSPSWLSIDELSLVMSIVNKYFDLSEAIEIAMELDPRHVTLDFMQALKDNGFNRVSFGVQDFDAKVQKAVNRIQPFELVQRVFRNSEQLGFRSTNFDLIYGLPLQNLATFTHTMDQVISLAPSRIALFNYAHLPNVFMPQTRINECELPSASEKLDILQMAVEKLLANNYVFIGMDHFAKPDDELAIALNNGTLHRNFQGYSICADTNLLSFGVSAIGMLQDSFYQNVKDLDSYYKMLDNGKLPIFRGIELTYDDTLRSSIIQEIMCRFYVDYRVIEQQYNINFNEYFKNELKLLDELVGLGLVGMLEGDRGFFVTNMGRFLVRNVAKVFDVYLLRSNLRENFSKVI